MRYSAPEKLEIINLVEQFSQSVRRMLDQLGRDRRHLHRYAAVLRLGNQYLAAGEGEQQSDVAEVH